MKLSSESVYPITRKFELFLIEQKLIIVEKDPILVEPSGTTSQFQFNYLGQAPDHVVRTAMTMHEVLGEYEHGTADPIELFNASIDYHPDCPKDDEGHDNWVNKQAMLILFNVYTDLLLSLLAG